MNSALRQREKCPNQTRLNRVVKNKLKKKTLEITFLTFSYARKGI